MNGNAAVDLIMARLGNRTEVALRPLIVSEMQLVQTDLLQRLDFKPWFLMSEDSTTSTTVGEPRVALPGDFIQEAEEKALWYTPSSTPVYLKRKDWDTLSEGYNDGGGNGPPEYYALSGLYFYLFPSPDAVYTMHLRYYQRDLLPLDAAQTNLWLTYSPKVLLAATEEVVASTHLHNPELAARATQELSTAIAALWKLNEERQHTNREYNMGESS